MLKYVVILFCLIFLSGCENTDITTATEAGLDAVKALTLSDQDVREIARESARYADERHTLEDEKKGNAIERLKGFLEQKLPSLYRQLRGMLP